jgi:hypothetical protein
MEYIMNIRIKILFLLIFLLLSCLKTQKKTTYVDYYIEGIRFLNNTKDFEEKNKLYLASYGLNLDAKKDSTSKNSIYQFEVTFDSLEKLDINNARKKIIKCTEEYLKEINDNEELKKYLYKYPFTNKELFLCISFYEINGESLKNDYITSCAVDENIVYYTIEYSDDSFERIHEEPYEQALEIVNNNITPDIPKNNKYKRIYIPSFDESEEIYPGINKITPKVVEKVN